MREVPSLVRAPLRGRREAFLGTDFTFEDMERRDVDDFDLELTGSEKRGRDTYSIVSATPRFGSGYARSEYVVADSDCQIVVSVTSSAMRSNPSRCSPCRGIGCEGSTGS